MPILKRKIEQPIRDYLTAETSRILLVEGARQVGKSFTIRQLGKEIFDEVIEINFVEDQNGAAFYRNVKTVEEFFLRLSIRFGEILSKDQKVLIFIDEIQVYPQFLTLLKFFNQDGRYKFIASGSLLGVTLKQTVSVPVGSVKILDMYPLDFEEFLWANGIGEQVVEYLKQSVADNEDIEASLHEHLLKLWREYLVVGGLPAVVNEFVTTKNFFEVKSVQRDIIRLYKADASQYDEQHKLLVNRIYDLIPSNMENKKKRMVIKEIEDKQGARYSRYEESFEYLISSGIALEVAAISNPRYPLAESATKNLMKLYMNDSGLLTEVLFRDNVEAVLDDSLSINLGSIYETAVATQLKSSGRELYYYDNKKKGEVDFLINDYKNATILPIEVKSGKDYKVHSALNKFLSDPEYRIKEGMVLSNSNRIFVDDKIRYIPIYCIGLIL